MKILHITTHMGGGVGKALSGLAAFEANHSTNYQHKIILLEQPEKLQFMEICRANSVEVEVTTDKSELEKRIAAADIVQLEWWHHPRMAGLLADFPQIPARLVVWCHISGCFYPYLSPEFLHIPLKFVFSSQYSMDNPYWSEAEKDFAARNCSVINSSGGFETISPRVYDEQREIFTVGYIGTQSYAKLNRDFIKFCNAIKNTPNVKFVMVGDTTNIPALIAEADSYGIKEKFEFIPYTSDVNAEFAKFDVFGYLLAPTHFGTTENVLLEAMAAGLPVVCLNQCAEKYLVQNNETGLLVNSIDEYAVAVNYLHSNPAERARLGNNARRYVLENFSVKRTVEQWHAVYEQILPLQKKTYDFRAVFGSNPHQYFLSCLPPQLKSNFDSVKELPLILKDKSKSSLLQFRHVYPENLQLRQWCIDKLDALD